MAFKEWLYNELMSQEIIDAEVTVEELSEDYLMDNCDITAEELEDFKNEYSDWCTDNDCEPEYDLQ